MSALSIKNAARGGAALQVEAAGIEPSDDFDATGSSICNCENCQGHFLASLDADLQRVMAAWERLPKAMRKAVLAIVVSND
jgi:hypothetical protein